MNNKTKELLLEKFEVIGRAADDCRYILEDREDLIKEEIKYKLQVRKDRVIAEMNSLEAYMKEYFF